MQATYDALKSHMGEIWDLTKAAAVLGWDRDTKMPEGGAASRTRQMTTLSRMIHERYASDKLGDLLESLDAWSTSLDYDSDEAGLIRLARREFTTRRQVPADLVRRTAQAVGEANQVWKKARAEADFAPFAPHLERIIALKKEYVACFPDAEHFYDPLLDQFEPGMKTPDVEAIFNQVREPQVALLREIAAAPQLDDSLVHQAYDPDAQMAAAHEIAPLLGYDFKRGRIDLTTHPFATSFSVNDARITTRVYPDFLNPCLFGTMHETGHAMYEAGVHERFEGLPLARGTSMMVHESQSRMFENYIGRSRAFAGPLLGVLGRHFPDQLGNVDADTFYRAINIVQPSFIRVEADEVSYNLHIIIRFELELALIGGDLAVADLPDAWDEKMAKYVGVRPANPAQGVLQDVHWSAGSFGYFPTYALGSILAAQFWAKIGADIPNRDQQLAEGETAEIVAWLREHIHQHGKLYPPMELVERVTGTGFSAQPFLDYLNAKFRPLYGI